MHTYPKPNSASITFFAFFRYLSVFLIALLAATVCVASEQTLLSPADGNNVTLNPSESITRSRAATLTASDLSNATVLSIDLFHDKRVTAEQVFTQTNARGALEWAGKIITETTSSGTTPSEGIVTLILHNNQLTGKVLTELTPYHLAKGENNSVIVKEITHTNDINGPPIASDVVDTVTYDPMDNISAPVRNDPNSEYLISSPNGEPPSVDPNNRTIRVLVPYTTEAKNHSDDILAEIDALITTANLVFILSNVTTQPVVELAGTMEVAYPDEAEDTMSRSLILLTLDGEGTMDEVHQRRVETEADLVILVQYHTLGAQGIAEMQPSERDNRLGRYRDGYAVASFKQSTTFIHELGHLMGAGHGEEGDNANSEDYAHGYVRPGDDATGDEGVRTLMANPKAECVHGGIHTVCGYNPCKHYYVFSNPELSANGEFFGTIDLHDNVRALEYSTEITANLHEFKHPPSFGTTVNIQIVYTQEALAQNPDLLRDIDSGYQSSRFIYLQYGTIINLVHQMEISRGPLYYPNEGEDPTIDNSLNRLADTTDKYYVSATNQRRNNQADFTVLVTPAYDDNLDPILNEDCAVTVKDGPFSWQNAFASINSNYRPDVCMYYAINRYVSESQHGTSYTMQQMAYLYEAANPVEPPPPGASCAMDPHNNSYKSLFILIFVILVAYGLRFRKAMQS